MKTSTLFKNCHHSFALLLAACVLLPASLAFAQTQTNTSEPAYSVIDRGTFYRVWQRTLSATNNLTGQITQEVQQYTELGDGMHYWSGANGGAWAESQDLIDLTPTGAEAIRGPMKASFSGDITSSGAITLTTAAGDVFQSHPIGLFYFDPASGKVAQIASAQSCQGTLYPPNVLVFSNVLSGLKADLMLVWAKNGFEQNVVLKQNLPRPESFGLSSATSRLQFWTAIDNWPAPKEQKPVTLKSGLVDHILTFTDCWFPVGSAFAFGKTPLPQPGQAWPVRLMDPSAADRIPVAKSLVSIADQTMLVEEVNYSDLLTVLAPLPQAALTPTRAQTVELADRGKFLPKLSDSKPRTLQMELAAASYSASGVILDYTTLSGNAASYTFASGSTYYIPTTFAVNPNTATFNQNACIKFATNAWLMLEGPVSFPASGSKVVFTSKDDNAYGLQIDGSTANPNYAAAQAIWMYYRTIPTTVQNVLIRWAQQGMHYTEEVNANLNPALNSSVFQNCTTGVYLDIANDTLHLSGDTYCNVVTPVGINAGNVSGSMTPDCGVVSVAMVNNTNLDSSGLDPSKNSQSECSFVVPDSSTVVAAFWNTHLSEYSLGTTLFPGISSPRSVGFASSTNGGVSFHDFGPIPPTSPTTTQGDAGDPVMAFDPGVGGGNGTIYLLANPSRELATWYGFRLWISTTKGQSFSPLNMDVPGLNQGNHLVTWGDKPMIAVDTSPTSPSRHHLYVAGTGSPPGLWAAHSADGGATWNPFQQLDAAGSGADIVITPMGTVYVFWLKTTYTPPHNVSVLRYAWLDPGGSWSAAQDFGITLQSTNADGGGDLRRFNGTAAGDFFVSNGFPRVTTANGYIYLVYADLPFQSSTTDRGDIWLAEALIRPNQPLAPPSVR